MRGYVSQSNGESFLIGFQESSDAIQFCIESQIKLNEAEWVKDILLHKNCKPVADGDLRGLRIQMGADFGLCKSTTSKGENKRQYFGKAISRAVKLTRACCGGQIVITEAVYNDAQEKLKAIANDAIIHQLGGDAAANGPVLYEIYPKTYQRRSTYFAQIQEMAHSLKDKDANNVDRDSNHLYLLPNAISASADLSSAVYKSHTPNVTSALQSHNITDSNSGFQEGIIFNLIDKKEWEIQFSDLIIIDVDLGSGSFGAVFSAKYKERRVAVKKMITGKNITSDESYILFISEVSVFSKLKHPNIIEFIGACAELPNLAIVMELVEPGNLRQLLLDQYVKTHEINRLKIISGIIHGMNYLHSLDPIIVHRDLKSANILVNTAQESKICDFGFARLKANNRTMTKCGTMAYQAPEVLKGLRYDEKADVYSFGIILWEIETRGTPYFGRDPLTLQFDVIKGLRPSIRKSMDESMVTFMEMCWDENPANRPSFGKLISEMHLTDLDIREVA